MGVESEQVERIVGIVGGGNFDHFCFFGGRECRVRSRVEVAVRFVVAVSETCEWEWERERLVL